MAGGQRAWVTYPGVFAKGRIDEGTALLAGALPSLPAGAAVLDYGCGTGVITAHARAKEPSLTVDMLDNDAVALAAARENVPEARAVLGARIADAGGGRYAAILSNPPLHRGIAEDHALLHQLIADAPKPLAPGGLLQIVVQRRIPLDEAAGPAFHDRDRGGGDRQLSRVARGARRRPGTRGAATRAPLNTCHPGISRQRNIRDPAFQPGSKNPDAQPAIICAATSTALPPPTPTARLRRPST